MIETSPPQLCTNSAESPNSSNVLMEGCDPMTFSTQDRELVSILEDLKILTLTLTITVLKQVTKRLFWLRNCV